MRKTTFVLATLAMLTGTAHSTCYTLYAADGRMLSSSPTPPYSMAWPAEDPVAKASRARGDHLIISQGGCHAVPAEQPKPTRKLNPHRPPLLATPAVPVGMPKPLSEQQPSPGTRVEFSANRPSYLNDRAEAEEQSKKLCAERHPDDYALRGGCLRNAMSGFDSLLEDHGMPRDVADRARALCASRHSGDYSLQGGCMRNQAQGYQSMR